MTQTTQNFRVVFNNGTWKVFSLWHYGDTATFALRKEADAAAKNLNAKYPVQA